MLQQGEGSCQHHLPAYVAEAQARQSHHPAGVDHFEHELRGHARVAATSYMLMICVTFVQHQGTTAAR